MSKETEEGRGAVAGQVQQPVRPCAWTLRAELDARETTCRAHLWFSDPVNSAWAPLYDQAALDAAVAEANRRQNAAWALMAERLVSAERERWVKGIDAAHADAIRECAPEAARWLSVLAGQILADGA